MDKITRQFLITHLPTGEQTVVAGTVLITSKYHNGGTWQDRARAAKQVGYRFPADCHVSLVRRGEEVSLPFGTLPLVIKPVQRPTTAASAA